MVFDGLILMIVGMLTVYLFLVLMNVMIKLLSSVFGEHALKEEKMLLDDAEAKRKKKREKDMKKTLAVAGPSADEVSRLTAVIAAAVHAHRDNQIIRQ
ncbi:MAG: OadG family protein [Chlorobium sp.]|uniref:OadG family protein n=1 Tax=Chlorobium sp. TaxID=1095 RepID=UPI0025C2B12D|nr:OadG family protein [Chlorobium sp.]MCF8216535.1 OadG family protein [Chlorobium sp.]MCF8271440.1 OadG family protein [Chlorobium sp.]MCF8287812.1 OadG family protein [Chlorobium sp.]MCF8291351.1 OadG family protein [Chlorobium sp.]MCF8385446.1 OadG family protein [Chlorobium sp.]